MGIIVSKPCYAVMVSKTEKRFDKKTAEAIIRNIIIALGEDERWIGVNKSIESELEMRHRIVIPKDNFSRTTFADSVTLRRESGILEQFVSNPQGVVRGWHGKIITGLAKEGIKTDSSITTFVFEVGQYVIKNNSPRPSRKETA